MTGLEKIIAEIQKLALSEADVIISEANAEAENILRENNEKNKTKTDAIIAKANNLSEGIAESTSSSVQIQSRQELLAVKQSLIKKTFNRSKEEVAELDDKSYLDLFSKMAAKISDGSGKLLLNQRDTKRIGKELLNVFPANSGVVLADETANILGGFLLVSGKITVNCSIEAIFADNRDQISDTIKQELFDD